MSDYLYRIIGDHCFHYADRIIQDSIKDFYYKRGTEPNKIYLSEALYEYFKRRFKIMHEFVYHAPVKKTLFGLELKIDTTFEKGKFMLVKEVKMKDDYIDSMRYAMDRYSYNDIATTMEASKKLNTKLPNKYIINKGATVLFWDDGSKTVVKRHNEDAYDIAKGFLWAYFQKTSGMSRTKANNYIAKIVEDTLNKEASCD